MRWKLLVSVFCTVLSLPTTEWYSNSVSYWPFESFSDRVIRDWTGNNNGKINGTVRSVNGIVGSAIELSGKYSWIDFGLLPATCLNEPEACSEGFTIAFWLKLPTFVGNRIIIQLGQNRHSRGFSVWTRRKKEKKINFSVNSKHKSFHSMLTWSTVDWTHVSLTWQKTEQHLGIYFNCSLVDSVKKPGPPGKSAKLDKVTLMVGASHGHNKNAHMLMDEFAIWNRTLTADELCRVVDIKTGESDSNINVIIIQYNSLFCVGNSKSMCFHTHTQTHTLSSKRILTKIKKKGFVNSVFYGLTQLVWNRRLKHCLKTLLLVNLFCTCELTITVNSFTSISFARNTRIFYLKYSSIGSLTIKPYCE